MALKYGFHNKLGHFSLNTRLGWKALPGTDTLDYYENPLITDVKSFITLAPDPVMLPSIEQHILDTNAVKLVY